MLIHYVTKKQNLEISEIFHLLEQVVKFSFPLPSKDPRFTDMVTSLVQKLDEDDVKTLSKGAATLGKLSSETKNSAHICLIYRNMFTKHKSTLSPTDYVHVVGLLAKHKSIEYTDLSVLRQLIEHAPALRPSGLAVLMEILTFFRHKELIHEVVDKVCLNIRSSDYLTVYSAADLTLGLWRFLPHLRSSVARGALYDLAQVWVPKFSTFSVNRKIQLLLAASELHVSIPVLDGFARALVRDVGFSQSAGNLSTNRLVDLIYMSALHNIHSDLLDHILPRIKIDKSVFAISAENRVNLLWALHILDRPDHPLVKPLVDHFNQISVNGVPYQLRSLNGYGKKLYDVVQMRGFSQLSFCESLVDGLAAADSLYFDRCVATTGFFREATALLKEFLRIREREILGGLLAPLTAIDERLVIEFDTGRDSYDLRLRRLIWRNLGFRVAVISERMWRTVKRTNTQRQFIQDLLQKSLRN